MYLRIGSIEDRKVERRVRCIDDETEFDDADGDADDDAVSSIKHNMIKIVF